MKQQLSPDLILLLRKGDEKKNEKIELWPAIFYDRNAPISDYRVMINGKWEPEKEMEFYSGYEILEILLKRTGTIRNEVKQDSQQQAAHQPELPNESHQQTDLDAKYQDQIAALNKKRYSPEEIDRYFATTYPLDIYKRQSEREVFDSLPSAERHAFLAKAIDGISTYQKIPSVVGNSEAERVNNASPEEQRKYMLKAQQEGQDRIKVDKEARKKEKELKQDSDLNDLPDEWGNDF